ncbi:MAG: dethiobiotin synthase [Cyclobacteriaceae bacterium]|nr:dethiobiotin synthase [Cyclobacteriaceae bacterium]
MKYFVTAIDTDSGKTLVSAILCRALKADYWKPVQAGSPTDSDQIKKWCAGTKIHAETYLLNTPESPHAAAKKEKIKIELDQFSIPEYKENLIIEGAGGLMVPLNDDELMIDLIEKLDIEVVLVCNLYLGSINHSLLSIEALQKRGVQIKGVVFNGDANNESEEIILKYAKAPCLLRIKKEHQINEEIIGQYAEQLLKKL